MCTKLCLSFLLGSNKRNVSTSAAAHKVMKMSVTQKIPLEMEIHQCNTKCNGKEQMKRWYKIVEKGDMVFYKRYVHTRKIISFLHYFASVEKFHYRQHMWCLLVFYRSLLLEISLKICSIEPAKKHEVVFSRAKKKYALIYIVCIAKDKYIFRVCDVNESSNVKYWTVSLDI